MDGPARGSAPRGETAVPDAVLPQDRVPPQVVSGAGVPLGGVEPGAAREQSHVSPQAASRGHEPVRRDALTPGGGGTAPSGEGAEPTDGPARAPAPRGDTAVPSTARPQDRVPPQSPRAAAGPMPDGAPHRPGPGLVGRQHDRVPAQPVPPAQEEPRLVESAAPPPGAFLPDPGAASSSGGPRSREPRLVESATPPPGAYLPDLGAASPSDGPRLAESAASPHSFCPPAPDTVPSSDGLRPREPRLAESAVPPHTPSPSDPHHPPEPGS